MDKKKLFLIVGALVILIALVTIIILSLGGEKEQLSPNESIVDIVLAKGKSGDGKPLSPTDLFVETDDQIVAFVTVRSLMAKSEIEYQWVSEEDDKIIKSEKRSADVVFSGTSVSELVRADKINWGIGSFAFRVNVNGKLVLQKKYRVITANDAQKNQVLSSIKDIVLTKEVDIYGKPRKPATTTFSTNDKEINASVTYQKIPKKVEFEARWHYLPENRVIDTYKKNIGPGDGVFAFSINADEKSWIPIKKWVKGRYKLQVYLDTELFREIEFMVE